MICDKDSQVEVKLNLSLNLNLISPNSSRSTSQLGQVEVGLARLSLYHYLGL
jgi:hypothetical protein